MNNLKNVIGRNCTCMTSNKDWQPGWWTVDDIRIFDSIINDIVIYLEFKLTRYIAWTGRLHTDLQLIAYTASGKIQYFMDWGEGRFRTEQELLVYCKKQDIPYKIYETY